MVEEAMRAAGANPGRSSHRMSVEADRRLIGARLLVARLFGAPSPDHVIFTLNCTDSLNIAIKGLLRPGDRVVTTSYEHNSVMRPLHRLSEQGVVVQVARPAGHFETDLGDFRRLCKQGLKAAVITHASNVTGYVHPVAEMAEAVHEGGGLLVLDAAQTAGRANIDMRELGVDVLAAPGHKGLYGPMGTGVLVLGPDIQIAPYREGGTGYRSEEDLQPVDLPFGLEAGTPNLPGIAGLEAGVRFVLEKGPAGIGAHEDALAGRLSGLLGEIPGVTVYLPGSAHASGIVSFTLDSIDVAIAGTLLDEEFGIGVRAGLHCSPAAHRAIGTFPNGTLRASFGFFNTEDDAERLVSAVKELSSD